MICGVIIVYVGPTAIKQSTDTSCGKDKDIFVCPLLFESWIFCVYVPDFCSRHSTTSPLASAVASFAASPNMHYKLSLWLSEFREVI